MGCRCTHRPDFDRTCRLPRKDRVVGLNLNPAGFLRSLPLSNNIGKRAADWGAGLSVKRLKRVRWEGDWTARPLPPQICLTFRFTPMA